MDYNLQKYLEHTINAMGTLLGVHPIVLESNKLKGQVLILPNCESSMDQ